ncbi:MAG TPA: colanic acid biosynthesis glycosyltransferase WcaL [Alphaproteobacteria bacterium]|nr:colanic acid biosynthesis glycosyltransferase WcaL [Alphaproteobacteria bacterium]
MTTCLCIVVKGFPRISETFITNELEQLESMGLQFTLTALRQPSGDPNHGAGHNLKASVQYLPEYLTDAPAVFASSWRGAATLPGFSMAWAQFQRDWVRDPTANRVRRFGQACILAASLPPMIRHIHAHFLHTPGSVARYASAMLGITWSASAHAKDIWTTPDWDLAEKLASARFVAVCNEAGRERLQTLAGPDHAHRIHFWPHQLNLSQAPPCHAKPGGPIALLTVARAVPKKGLPILLDALRKLSAEPAWSWTLIGGGELLDELKASLANHPFANRIRLLGSQPHTVVRQHLAAADVFVLPAQVTADGDRDGRPNALLEAMAAGLACIATAAGGIPEVISDGQNGCLTLAEPEPLSLAISRLMQDQRLRSRLGHAAAETARTISAQGERAIKSLAQALREAGGQS